MSLYELTIEASSVVEIYGDDAILVGWVESINPVLSASGQQLIGNGIVKSITIGEKEIRIRYSHKVHFFYDEIQIRNVEIVLPEWVLRAEDSVEAAKEWRVRRFNVDTNVGGDVLREKDAEIEQLKKRVSALERKLDILWNSVSSYGVSDRF